MDLGSEVKRKPVMATKKVKTPPSDEDDLPLVNILAIYMCVLCAAQMYHLMNSLLFLIFFPLPRDTGSMCLNLFFPCCLQVQLKGGSAVGQKAGVKRKSRADYSDDDEDFKVSHTHILLFCRTQSKGFNLVPKSVQ